MLLIALDRLRPRRQEVRLALRVSHPPDGDVALGGGGGVEGAVGAEVEVVDVVGFVGGEVAKGEELLGLRVEGVGREVDLVLVAED